MFDQQSLKSACACAQSDQSLCLSLEYSLSVKLLTEHHLEFLSLAGGCTGSSESTLVKIPHCWKSHVAAQVLSIPHLRNPEEARKFEVLGTNVRKFEFMGGRHKIVIPWLVRLYVEIIHEL